MKPLRARELGALSALASVLAITGVWWALALWPLPGDAPAWLARTRAVCFGSVSNGLPSTAGWMALIGQPLYMLATLWLISGRSLASGMQALGGSPAGRVLLQGSGLVVAVALTAAGVRVARAATGAPAEHAFPAVAPAEVPRLDRPAPPLSLVDQTGRRITLAQFRNRPVFLTFAYAHCETVCPLVVHDLLRAREQARELEPVVLVVTLDPWRDTPSRLEAIATQWGFDTNAFVLSGTVPEVEQTLDVWRIGRQRDPRTGELIHAPFAYLIARDGRIAFEVNAGAQTIAALARRL